MVPQASGALNTAAAPAPPPDPGAAVARRHVSIRSLAWKVDASLDGGRLAVGCATGGPEGGGVVVLFAAAVLPSLQLRTIGTVRRPHLAQVSHTHARAHID